MSVLAQIHEEHVALARADERGYRCDVCHTALGDAFFDWFWACAACRDILAWRLRREQSRPSPAFREDRS
jgi:hypothetical protein